MKNKTFWFFAFTLALAAASPLAAQEKVEKDGRTYVVTRDTAEDGTQTEVYRPVKVDPEQQRQELERALYECEAYERWVTGKVDEIQVSRKRNFEKIERLKTLLENPAPAGIETKKDTPAAPTPVTPIKKTKKKPAPKKGR